MNMFTQVMAVKCYIYNIYISDRNWLQFTLLLFCGTPKLTTNISMPLSLFWWTRLPRCHLSNFVSFGRHTSNCRYSWIQKVRVSQPSVQNMLGSVNGNGGTTLLCTAAADFATASGWLFLFQRSSDQQPIKRRKPSKQHPKSIRL